MKITIDTKEDSPEEIRKLIRMLLALIGESGYGEKTPPASGEGLFDMFGSPESSTSEQQQMAGDAPKPVPEVKGDDDDIDFKVIPY